MKCLTVILVISTISQIATGFLIHDIVYEIAKSVLDDKLKEFLVSLKPMLKTGNSSLGVPKIDPYVIDFQEFHIAEDIISVDGSVTDLKVDGASDYKVDEAKFRLAGLKLKLNMTWDNVRATSFYKFWAESKGIPMYGDGDFDVEISDVTFAADAQLALQANKVFMKNLSTNTYLGAIKLDVRGLYNNEIASKTISTIITKTGAHFFNGYHNVIKSEIDNRLMKLINSYLGELTLQDIINILG